MNQQSIWQQLRAQTPGTSHSIHLNSAGAALMPRCVSDAVITYLDLESRIGGYEAAAQQSAQLEALYATLARIIGARPGSIALSDSATRSWNMAFWAVDWRDGDKIFCTEYEYGSNYLSMLRLKQKYAVDIQIIRNTPSGDLDLEELRARLDPRVKVVSIVHMPSTSGAVVDAMAVGEILRDHPCLYFLDSCQAVGQMPIDVTKIGCDVLSTTGRKYLRAPRGTGFLYLSDRALSELQPAWVDMRAATWLDATRFSYAEGAQKFEAWEKNYAALMGLSAAAELYETIDQDAAWSRIASLAQRIREQLQGIKGIKVHDQASTLSGIVSFSSSTHSPQLLFASLQKQGISTVVAPLQAGLLDMKKKGLDTVLRASAHYYNSEDEIDLFCRALAALN